MATKIFHGKPGSYKSSTATWFELLPALRAGRFVVSNIEGLKSLEEIEQALNEKFPETARLLRISTLNEKGVRLIQSWFHWLPVGALLLIDEIQCVYDSTDRTEFKFLNRDLNKTTTESINSFEDLPADVKAYSISLLGEIVDDGYKDDIGHKERDADGLLIYPANLKDALMRHRKFNWDIISCTPDISKVHTLYRSVSEVAISHKSFDFMPLPWFQRRPRTHEHNALEKGLKPTSGDTIRRQKIPLAVFSLYKSTQTGRNNKSGAAKNPFKNAGFIFVCGSIMALVLFLVAANVFTSNQEKDVRNKAGEVASSQASDVNQISVANTQADNYVSNRDVSHTLNVTDISFLDAIGVRKIFLTAVVSSRTQTGQGMRDGKRFVDYSDWAQQYAFELVTDTDVYTVSGNELIEYGYSIDLVSDCSVKLAYNETVRYMAFCKPLKSYENEVMQDNSSESGNSAISLFGSI